MGMAMAMATMRCYGHVLQVLRWTAEDNKTDTSLTQVPIQIRLFLRARSSIRPGLSKHAKHTDYTIQPPAIPLDHFGSNCA